MPSQTETQQSPSCCPAFEAYATTFGWMPMQTIHGTMFVMPHIDRGGDTTKWRVNHCPTCGKEIRNIQYTEEQFKNLG